MNIKKRINFKKCRFLRLKPAFLADKTAVFQRKEQSLFPIKSTKSSLFQLLSILKDSVVAMQTV